MFRVVTFLIVVCLAGSSTLWAQGSAMEGRLPEVPEGTLTLIEAQRIALTNAPGIDEAVARIEAARGVVDRAESSLWPQVSVTAGYRLQDSTMQPDWDPTVRIDEQFNNLAAGIQVNWLVFDGFARKARILAAKAGSEGAEAGLQEARRLLSDAVGQAFFQAQLAAEKMRIARNNQEFNRLLESDADKRWRAGTIAEAEKLNFSVRALQAESDYLADAQNFKVVSVVLAELLALPDRKLSPRMHPVSAMTNDSFAPIPDLDVVLVDVLQHRSDLQVLTSRLVAAEQQENVARADYFPKVVLNGGYDYSMLRDIDPVDQEEHDAYVGLNLSWNLFSGGERSARTRENRAETRQIRAQLEQAKLAVRSEVTQAVERATSVRAMYQRQEEALTMMFRIRDHIEKAYRAGVTTLTRLNEAQRDLVQMAGLTAYSRINYQIALEDLKTASGQVIEIVGTE